MKPNRLLKGLALAAIVFGLVTIVSGGRAQFGSMEVRAAMGYTVPFVLWFNVLAGAGSFWGNRGPLIFRSYYRSPPWSSSSPSAFTSSSGVPTRYVPSAQ